MWRQSHCISSGLIASVGLNQAAQLTEISLAETSHSEVAWKLKFFLLFQADFQQGLNQQDFVIFRSWFFFVGLHCMAFKKG
jgi:hypothetical protein